MRFVYLTNYYFHLYRLACGNIICKNVSHYVFEYQEYALTIIIPALLTVAFALAASVYAFKLVGYLHMQTMVHYKEILNCLTIYNL